MRLFRAFLIDVAVAVAVVALLILTLQVMDLRDDSRHQGAINREASRSVNVLRENSVDAQTEQWESISDIEEDLAKQRARIDSLEMAAPRLSGALIPMPKAAGCEKEGRQ